MSDFKKNWDFIAGIVFIAFVTGMAAASWESGTCSWWIPIAMFLLTGFPFLFGYQAGKKAEKP